MSGFLLITALVLVVSSGVVIDCAPHRYDFPDIFLPIPRFNIPPFNRFRFRFTTATPTTLPLATVPQQVVNAPQPVATVPHPTANVSPPLTPQPPLPTAEIPPPQTPIVEDRFSPSAPDTTGSPLNPLTPEGGTTQIIDFGSENSTFIDVRAFFPNCATYGCAAGQGCDVATKTCREAIIDI